MINDNTNKAKVIVVIGPTSIGKSDIAIEIAETLHSEIISADSRLVYRYMDIGTAKPSRDELNTVKHHFIDVIDPDDKYSVAEYKDNVYSLIKILHRDNMVPVIVGGTGQYVWALLENWQFVKHETDFELRENLLKRAANGDDLYSELMDKNPERAEKIDPRNVRRVVRALELEYGNKSQSEIQKMEPFFDYYIVGLTSSREYLYKRIDSRVDNMVSHGLIKEVEDLLKRYPDDLPSLSGIGYKQIIEYLNGKSTLDEAILSVKTNTHRLARMQYNWFKLSDERIHWYDIEVEGYRSNILNDVQNYLK